MGEIPPIPKRGFNPDCQSKYTTLDDILQTVHPIFTKHGLVWFQGSRISIYESVGEFWNRIYHVQTGEWAEQQIVMTVPKGDDPWAAGSMNSYGKRYSAKAFLGISDAEDDDGSGARAAAQGQGRPGAVQGSTPIHPDGYLPQGVVPPQPIPAYAAPPPTPATHGAPAPGYTPAAPDNTYYAAPQAPPAPAAYPPPAPAPAPAPQAAPPPPPPPPPQQQFPPSVGPTNDPSMLVIPFGKKLKGKTIGSLDNRSMAWLSDFITAQLDGDYRVGGDKERYRQEKLDMMAAIVAVQTARAQGTASRSAPPPEAAGPPPPPQPSPPPPPQPGQPGWINPPPGHPGHIPF